VSKKSTGVNSLTGYVNALIRQLQFIYIRKSQARKSKS